MTTVNPISKSQHEFLLENNPDFLIKFIIDNNPDAVLKNIQAVTGREDQLDPTQIYLFIITLFEARQLKTVEKILNVKYDPTVSEENYTSGFREYFRQAQIMAVASGDDNLADPNPSKGSLEDGNYFYNVRLAIQNVQDTIAADLTQEDLAILKLPPEAISVLGKLLNLEVNKESLDAIKKTETEKKVIDKTKSGISIPAVYIYVIVGLVILLAIIMLVRGRAQ